MIPYTVLSSPVNMPYACVWCAGQKGPVIASHRQLRGYGDVYLCEDCAKNIAREFGYVDGKKAESLQKAIRTQDAHEREIDALRAGIAERDANLTRISRYVEEVQDRNAKLEQRVEQLEDRLRDEARAALSLVGGEAA